MKNDKSKLRGREVYKVVEVFVKDDENWAKLQKSETQFRSKEYLVKCAEIFHVPVPAVDTKDDEKVLEESDTSDVQENDDVSVPHVDTDNDEKLLVGNDVPAAQDKDADNIPIQFEELQPCDDKTKDVIQAVPEDDVHDPFEDQTNSSSDQRPRRRAAMRNERNIKEMLAMGVL